MKGFLLRMRLREPQVCERPVGQNLVRLRIGLNLLANEDSLDQRSRVADHRVAPHLLTHLLVALLAELASTLVRPDPARPRPQPIGEGHLRAVLRAVGVLVHASR